MSKIQLFVTTRSNLIQLRSSSSVYIHFAFKDGTLPPFSPSFPLHCYSYTYRLVQYLGERRKKRNRRAGLFKVAFPISIQDPDLHIGWIVYGYLRVRMSNLCSSLRMKHSNVVSIASKVFKNCQKRKSLRM